MKPLLIVQNDPLEGAARFSTQISDRGIEQRTVLGFDTDYTELSSDDYAGLVVLGGAQGAYETDAYPYLLDEVGLCQDFLCASKPIIGLCLGAQLLACALDGKVEPGAQREVGWYELHLSDAAANDFLLEGHPKTLMSYHFHGDCIREAPGATVLASSALTPIQLFRYGENAYGLQYHAEVDAPSLELMCRNNHDYLDAVGASVESILAKSEIHLPDFERYSRAMLERWLDLTASPA